MASLKQLYEELELYGYDSIAQAENEINEIENIIEQIKNLEGKN